MNINPHLNFNGQCKEAFEFYERVLGGKISFSMTWGEMPGGAAAVAGPGAHANPLTAVPAALARSVQVRVRPARTILLCAQTGRNFR